MHENEPWNKFDATGPNMYAKAEKLQEVQYEENLKDVAEIFREKMDQAGGEYSETLMIDPDGSMHLSRHDEPITSLFSHLGHESPEAIMKLAFDIQKKFPEFTFSFEKDPEGKWLKYTVSR